MVAGSQSPLYSFHLIAPPSRCEPRIPPTRPRRNHETHRTPPANLTADRSRIERTRKGTGFIHMRSTFRHFISGNRHASMAISSTPNTPPNTSFGGALSSATSEEGIPISPPSPAPPETVTAPPFFENVAIDNDTPCIAASTDTPSPSTPPRTARRRQPSEHPSGVIEQPPPENSSDAFSTSDHL